MTQPVTNEEVKNAIFSIGSTKSPGPDGMSAIFYQKYWHIVGPSVTKAVKSFFHSGQMLKQINHTFITLIPKCDNPSSTNHYRPISLCTTVYKTISKIITNRIKKVLEKLIHPLQGAFVANRAIQDNILIAHEVFHSFKSKKGKEGWMAIKLDMEKAYDKIEWNFLFAVLKKFGFCPQVIDWIKVCVSSVTFSVLVNNGPTEVFTPQRGLRQGDPLSPFLFILCAEVLARKIQFESNINKNIGFPIIKNGTRIPFLSFADDIIIFTKANKAACETIKEIISGYCAISGQTINYHKSAFQTTPKTSSQNRRAIQDSLNMSSTVTLDKYLGCPIINGRVTKDSFRDIITSSQSQLAKWKASSLSQEGRATLIRSNLSARPNFLMQNFMLPSSIHRDLDKINRQFFWNK